MNKNKLSGKQKNKLQQKEILDKVPELSKPAFKHNYPAYLVILILTFILYGNTLNHEYTLDDAIVIKENEYVLSGTDGIKDIFSEELFNGFFDQKDKNLVVGGRYRPMSLLTFALEYEFFMGTPFDGLDEKTIERKVNLNQPRRFDENKKEIRFISNFRFLHKELFKCLFIEDTVKRTANIENLLSKHNMLSAQEKQVIRDNLSFMQERIPKVQFVSHFVNVLLYALTGIFLFMVLSFLLIKYNTKKWYFSFPFIASLIFVAHPVHTEVIANIKGRDEIMALLFSLISLWFVIKYTSTKNILWLALTFLAFLTAVFSKEVAIPFLAVIPLAIYFFTKEKFANILISIVPLFLATIVYLYIRQNVIAGISSADITPELMNDSFKDMNPSQALAAKIFTLGYYLKVLTIPHPLTYDYYPYHLIDLSISLSKPTVIFSLLLNLGLLGYIIYLAFVNIKSIYKSISNNLPKIERKGNPVLAFGAMLYFITILPTSNLFFPIGVFMNERFVYGASIGFALILAWLISVYLPKYLKSSSSKLYSVAGIFIILLILYSFKTIDRNKAWKNDFTLFETDVKTSVNSAKSNCSYGGELVKYSGWKENEHQREQMLRKAIKHLEQSVKVHPSYADALILLGNAHWELNKNMDSTLLYYGRILELNPYHDRTRKNLFETIITQEFNKPENVNSSLKHLHYLENISGKITYKTGKVEYKKFGDLSWEVNHHLGRNYGRFRNNLDSSIYYLEKANNLQNGNLDVLKDLGTAYGMKQNFGKSSEYLGQALKIAPNDATMIINQAMNFFKMNNNAEGLQMLEKIFSINLKKEDAQSLLNMVQVYRNLQMPEKEQQVIQLIAKLDPSLFKQQ
ncbi:MAG: hypothetical protein JXR58_04500 [Bacteroidales bacterium]|nr:hypothetical protein [Bacteroidales bacterium]